jgi:hypothetical protein
MGALWGARLYFPMQSKRHLSVFSSVVRILFHATMWPPVFRLISVIWRHFFWFQHKNRFLHQVPVTAVDHPLDRKIAFEPEKVGVYLDFTPFWIRAAGFFLYNDPAHGLSIVKQFLIFITSIYEQAFAIYKLNLSTTNRPNYYRKLRFLLIHITDPHLMCIPSLHVMLVVGVYTSAAKILGRNSQEALEARKHAGAITESILFVKQHSVNCIPAAFYAQHCLDPHLFPVEEALDFNQSLELPPEIKDYISAKFLQYCREGKNADDWREPLLNFLRNYKSPVE